MSVEKVAVLGGGLMGSGIAESVARAGLEVTIRAIEGEERAGERPHHREPQPGHCPPRKGSRAHQAVVVGRGSICEIEQIELVARRGVRALAHRQGRDIVGEKAVLQGRPAQPDTEQQDQPDTEGVLPAFPQPPCCRYSHRIVEGRRAYAMAAIQSTSPFSKPEPTAIRDGDPLLGTGAVRRASRDRPYFGAR